MKRQTSEISIDLEKPKHQTKSWKGKTDAGFLILTLIFLAVVAAASYYFK